tara:strand:- start:2346 stop:2684 length:339 start_codon:yes stop_codon:yes gene_type:complete
MIVATILLILALSLIGVALSNLNSKVKYPPLISDCPDYWTVDKSVDSDGNQDFKCINTKELGINNNGCNEYDNSLSIYKGTGGLCQKKMWADKCNITWDGVTNNPDANKDCW